MLILMMLMAAATDQSAPLKPLGDPRSWVKPDDYPVAAIRAHEAGAVGFTLEVDSKGAVANCIVNVSSGSSTLDSATCEILSARAHFTPAKDENGRPISAKFTSKFTWELPGIDSSQSWSGEQDSMIEIDASYGPDGALLACNTHASKNVTTTSDQLCGQVAKHAPVRTVDGKPVGYHQIMTLTTRYHLD